MKKFALIASAALLTSCAQSSSIPLAKNLVQITSSTAPVCGVAGTQRVATTRAAVETIKRGYERFIVMGGQYQNTMRVAGYTPVTAHTTGRATANTYGNTTNIYGSARTTYSGGNPITIGGHSQGLIVKMFNPGEKGYKQAVPAKKVLGPKWQDAVNKPSYSCF